MTSPVLPLWCEPIKSHIDWNVDSNTWRLADGARLEVGTMARALGIPWNDWPALLISSFDLTLDDDVDEVSISVDSWTVTSKFKLQPLGVQLRHRSGQFVARLWSTLCFTGNDAALCLTGIYSSENQGASLNLRASLDGPFTIKDLIDGLLEPLELGFSAPDLLAAIELDSVDCSLSIGLENGSVTEKVLELDVLFGDSAPKWEVIPGFLEFSPRSVLITSAQRFVSARASASANVLGANWLIEIDPLNMRGSARLDADGASVNGLFEHLRLDVPDGLGDLKLAGGELSFDGKERSASLFLAIGDVWKSEHFQVERIELRVGYQSGENGGTSAELEGVVKIDSVELHVRATHEGPGLGWTFEAALGIVDETLSVGALGACFGLGELPLADLTLTNLGLYYETLSGRMHLGCGLKYNDAVRIQLDLEVSRGTGEAKQVRFSGHLDVHGAQFDLIFSHDGTGDVFVASYRSAHDQPLTLDDVMRALGVSDVPELPAVQLEQALLVVDRPSKGGANQAKKLAIAADLDVDIDFSGLRTLPVLGECLPRDCSVGVALGAAYGKGWDAKGLPENVTALLPSDGPTLPPSFDKLHVDAKLRLGGRRFDLKMPTGAQDRSKGTTAVSPTASAAPALPAAKSEPTWTPVDQNLGGMLHVRRVGASLEGHRFGLNVDGSVTLQAVTLDLMGLGLGFDLQNHALDFDLLGLGFSVDRPPLRISAAFLNADGDFVGRAEIQTSTFGLTALGGFSSVGGSPSIFLYGVLDYPLGGPSFFFVEGLAAGFGVNRRLTLPKVENVESFPLVVDAVKPRGAPMTLGSGASANLSAKLTELHESLHPALGEHFFAVGLKFNSFKLLEGFGLAVVSIDTTRGGFTLVFLGVATWSSPTPPNEAPGPATMAWLRVLMLATMNSSESSLIVQAQLAPGCFVASQKCHLRGGVAAGFWFGGEHAGDFVYSVGGYHPSFARPTHYPLPAAIGFDWQVTDGIAASGSLYYAITPRALMFGFAFHAVWDAGPVTAWFDLALDFLMTFKPVHYDASGHIELGASISTWFGDITVHAGAELHIWGPSFSGRAKAHLGPFSVSMSFGDEAGKPPALNRSKFLEAFFPVQQQADHLLSSKCISVIVERGLSSTFTGDDHVECWQVVPKDLALRIESLLPLSGVASSASDPIPARQFLVPPMGHTPMVAPVVRLRLMREGSDVEITHHFESPAVVESSFPCALWANPQDARATRMMAPSGVRLEAITPPDDVGARCFRKDLDHERLEVDVERASGHPLFALAADRTRAARTTDRQAIVEALRNTQQKRHEILTKLCNALGEPSIDPALIDLNPETLVNGFLETPQLVERVRA